MRNIFIEILMLVYAMLLCTCCVDGVRTYIVNTFSDPSNLGEFNHLAIDRNSQTVFIGAVNSLYQLNSRLNLLKTAITGPHKDNPRCPPDNCVCTDTANCHLYKKVLTDSVCKGLVIDYDNNNIITCSNLLQGYCVKRKLDSIDITTSQKYHYKVPWDNSSSTVMFISNGPGSGLRPVPVLYIAATRSTVGESAYKDIVPTISSRSLDTLDYAKNDHLRTKSAISIESQMRDSFRVNYVHGFGAGGFSYFTTVQRRNRDSLAYESKLVRICQSDDAYRSYVEVPLKCHFAGTSYNLAQAMYVGKTGVHVARSLKVTELVDDVLFGVFSIGQPNTDQPTSRSALCMYSLKEIRKIFTQNIRACFQGNGFTGPDHLVNPQPCSSGSFQIDQAYCGKHDYNHPINGTIPVTAIALKTFHASGLSSLAVIPTMNYTAAFLGTSNGHIKKVIIESSSSAHEYEDITIDQGSKVNPDMLLSTNNNYLYVMTRRKLTRVKVQDCHRYTTCRECLTAKDPFCGWCSLENRCTTYSTCPEASQTWRWLPAPSGVQCTTITSIQPSQVQIEQGVTSTLRLSIQNLPVITNSNYECAFSGYNKVAESSAYKTSTGVRCLTPYYTMLPRIPDKQDHIVMKLAVRVNGRAFVSRNFTFFDCTVHRTCTGCTSSAFPCTWCIKHHKCVHKSAVCASDVLVTGKNVLNSHRPGPLNCPKIDASFTEVLVPSNTRKAVVVRSQNLESFQTDLRCHFHMKSGTVEVVAVHEGAGTVRCTEITFSYSEHVGSMKVPFRITWGPQKHALDNPLNIKVKVYKCSAMASDCGTCLTLDAKYYCGWCDPVCSIGTSCSQGNFLSTTATCPNPRIIRFYPNSGPVRGGTNLTIEGVNLGKIQSDVSVKVANYGCRITSYVKAKKIVCETTASSTPVVGPVVVTVESKYSGQSANAFYYVIPKIRKISPLKGPLSGGTRLTLYGNDMNAGSTIRATIIGLPCRIISTSQDATVCVTSPAMVQTSGLVHATFDGYEVQYTNQMFRYVDDPTVLNVEREKAIVSGGVRINVRGSNLDAVQNTKMYMMVRGKEYTNNCQISSQTEMVCLSPDLSEAGIQYTDDEAPQFTYGFIMQNIRVKKNDTDGGPLFGIHPNPDFERFPDGTHSFQTRNIYLTINGKNINSALRESDVTVQIGDGFCAVTSVASSQLTCRPPEKQPKSIGGGGGNPKVKIIVGTNLTFDLGHLTYDKPDGVLSNTMIISIAVSGGVLILIIIAVAIAYKRKSKERDRVMKRMQKEMDVLECRVAKECKEAFAELQTDMTELTSDLSGVVGIPFLPYRSFCIQILFPTCDEYKHPITRELEFGGSRKDQTERGLKLFEQLIHNKTFLLLFIRTLESSKSFTMRDKVNVASLISVALHCNMMYYTDILKTLLAELIEKSMEGRNNPKLLLRRTDSVGEKMLTNWFAFLLYRFLKECVGEPLFMVFQAIKQQVSKGPVDAVSSEAKYSLSEDKLIRQQVEYRQMTLNVIDYDLQYGSQEHPVRVLDVDTISQVKEKILDAIYKNAPFSVRPNKDDLDLEWRTGVQGRLVLNDQDMTSKMDGDFKRLNTLAHYKVSDGALMALVRRVNPIYSVTYTPDKITMYPKYENVYANSSPQMNCSLSPSSMTTLHHIDIDNNIRQNFHLVKQHDNDNHKEGDRGSKMVSEIYLTRLLSTKGTLQQFVDDLFETIFSTAHRGSALPLAIKYLFDFLDDQALHHGITDPEVVHTWKSNSLPLRFWVNVIKNPNFVFDVHKSNIVDSCLSVIAQTFMDSCSMKDHRLGKDSPSSKLLYAKDIPKYKKWVERYYQDIKMIPAISDQDMAAELGETTKYSKEFNVVAALNELYSFVVRYNDQLMRNLEEDEFARTYKLAIKLEQVHSCMESTV